MSLRPDTKLKKEVPTNVLTKGPYQALNALALYGPNASGKSNLLAAISLLDQMVSTSVKWASTDRMPYDPFLLRAGWEQKPTELEVTFVANDRRYRYGVIYTADGVQQEWLYRKIVGREVPMFEREEDTIETNKSLVALPEVLKAVIASTRPNSLFLSWCDTYNIPEIKAVMQWFSRLQSVDALALGREGGQTEQMLDDPEFAPAIRDYLTSLSLRVFDVKGNKIPFDVKKIPADIIKTMPQELAQKLKGAKQSVVLATHQLYDADGQPTTERRTWEWAERESAGANQALRMSGPVLRTLTNGGVLVIDEIEARLHTQITLYTISLFLDPKTNKNGAQLLFATHDTNLLTYAPLRRDQICFTEKNAWEGTETYSLADFQYLPAQEGQPATSERPDADKEKRYLEGRYGAIPATADFKRFVARQSEWPVPEK